VTREEAGAAGAAMMAAVQQKIFPAMQDCVAQWVDPLLGPVTPPDAGLVAIYDSAFRDYKNTRQAMRPVWKAMAARNSADAP
jgi:erythritol kinase